MRRFKGLTCCSCLSVSGSRIPGCDARTHDPIFCYHHQGQAELYRRAYVQHTPGGTFALEVRPKVAKL